jgi:hypothetical protein
VSDREDRGLASPTKRLGTETTTAAAAVVVAAAESGLQPGKAPCWPAGSGGGGGGGGGGGSVQQHIPERGSGHRVRSQRQIPSPSAQGRSDASAVGSMLLSVMWHLSCVVYEVMRHILAFFTSISSLRS